MVIIRERQARTGGYCYDMEELSTGVKKTWYPPKNLPKSDHMDMLKNAAVNFERQAIANHKAPIFLPAIDMDIQCNEGTPFSIYVEKVFMPRRSVIIAEHTRDNWQRFLDLRILPALGRRPIGGITAGNLTDFLLNIQSEGLAKSSVDKYHTLLSNIFRMAAATDVIPSNPMEKVERPKARKDELIKDEVDAFTASEIAYIESCLKKEPLKWQCMIYLLNDTGLRIGECCALTWNDVDFEQNRITVTKSLNYTPAKGIYVSTPKNRRGRTVYTSSDIMDLLRLLYKENTDTVNSLYIFHQNASAEPIHPQSPGKYLKKFQQRYGISHIYPHKLRHSYASIAVTNGADIASIASNLGHKDSTVTMRRYVASNEQAKLNANCIRRDAVRHAADKQPNSR